MQPSVDLGSWHFQQASRKAQWIICRRLNTERLREVDKDRERKKKKIQKWNWAEKKKKNERLWYFSRSIMTGLAARGRVQATHNQTLRVSPRMIHRAALTLNALLQGRGCCSGCLSQTTTGHIYASVLHPRTSPAYSCGACGCARP